MRYAVVFLTLAMILSVIPGIGYSGHVIDSSKNPQYLFTLAAKSGSLDGNKLTLKGVPLAVYFSDRPNRIAGHITLEKFVEMWDKGIDNFDVNPPSADIAIYDESGDKHAVLIISVPVVKGDTISFTVRVFDERIPKSFGHATLFIDSTDATSSLPDDIRES